MSIVSRKAPSLNTLSVVVSAGVVLSIIIMGILGWLNSEVLLEPPVALEPGLALKYRAVLESQGTSDPERIHALIELSRAGDLMAREDALRLVGSEQTVLRAGAADALGYFVGSESRAALRSLLSDREGEVRQRAISALCRVRGRQRKSLIAQVGGAAERPLTERLPAWICSYRLAGREEDRASALKSFEAVLDPSAWLVRQSDARLAFAYLTSSVPERPETHEWARAIIEGQATDPGLLANAIRFLASRAQDQHAAGLAAGYRRWMEHQEAVVRLAATESIHFFCPADRWKLLEERLSREVDSQVREAVIRAASYLDPENGVKFIEAVRSQVQLPTNEATVLEDAAKRVVLPGRVAACSGH